MRQGWFESRGLRCCLPSSGSRRTGRNCRIAGRRGVVGAGGGYVAGTGSSDVAGAVGGGGVAGASDVAGAVCGDVAGTAGGVVAGAIGGGVCTGSRSAADLRGGRSGGSPPAQCSIPSSCPPDLSTIREQLK
jgi:hypothetical protein